MTVRTFPAPRKRRQPGNDNLIAFVRARPDDPRTFTANLHGRRASASIVCGPKTYDSKCRQTPAQVSAMVNLIEVLPILVFALTIACIPLLGDQPDIY
jgi:hypothetical protein